MENNRDVEFLFEVGCLRHVPRTWKQFLGVDFHNLAEHHFRVMWLSLILANKENADIKTFELIDFVKEVDRISKGTVIIFCGNEQYSTIYKYKKMPGDGAVFNAVVQINVKMTW